MKNLKLTFIFLLTTMFCFAEVSTSEKDALLALYNSTNGASWNTTWDLESPISTWHGVTVENAQVIALDLAFNNLEGQLPEQIGDLVNLKSIKLGFNKLSGNLPQSLSNLQSLEHLELFLKCK